MNLDSTNNSGERRAGLFSRRFAEPATPSPGWHVQDTTQPPEWFEADMHVVDADMRIVDADIRVVDERAGATNRVVEPPVTPESPEILVAAAETLVEKTGAPGVSPTIPAPRQHALAVWELIPSPNVWGDSARTEASLAAALRQAPQVRPAWWTWLSRGSQSKKAPKETLALELAGVGHQARLFLRGPVPLVARVYDSLATAYQGIQRVILDPDIVSDKDPLAAQLGEGVSYAELHLASPAIFPLKTASFTPDPLTEVIQASTHNASGAPLSLRVVSQLLITPAPPKWKQRNLAFLEKQRALRATSSAPKAGNDGQQMGLSIVFLIGMIVLFLAARGLLVLLWVVVLPLGTLLGSLWLLSTWRRWRLSWRLLRHEQEVTQKLSQELVQVCLRLYVLGPVDAIQAREAALDRLIKAYGAYAGLNRWKVGRRGQMRDLMLAYLPQNQQAGETALYGHTMRKTAEQYYAMRNPDQIIQPLSWWQRLAVGTGDQARPILGLSEVAALWHVPASRGQPFPFQPPGEVSFSDEARERRMRADS
jgi:hypothetical protein